MPPLARSVVVSGWISLTAAVASAGGSDGRCEGAKLAAAGRYAECRLSAEAAALKKGGAPDFGKCDAGLAKAWSTSEAKAFTLGCPTSDDLDPVRDAIAYETDRLAFWLDGFARLGAGRVPATGQTVSSAADRNDGVPGAVGVPDDGAVEAGAERRVRDNGDGTITDLVTGLMWEKKSFDLGLHDLANVFPWSGDGTQDTIWDWLQDVNGEGGVGFAGYSDWRVPNIRELLTLADYGREEPSIDPIFEESCHYPCTVLGCNCTATLVPYWSSTTGPDDSEAWYVSFRQNGTGGVPKDLQLCVRAVRGEL